MTYPSIRIEGAILSPDILGRIEELPGQRPADFALDASTKVKDEIARAWADAKDYWRMFQGRLETVKKGSNATTETRNLWIVPLMGLLRYDIEYQPRGTELNGRIYVISHRATNQADAPVQIIGSRDQAGLDRKPANDTRRMSAHALVQEFLNLHDQLYGLVTDGHVLRLLRDSSRLVKQSYLEFDLDRIFTDGLFADFAVLYRLLHATRLPLTNDTAATSLIEQYHQDSLPSMRKLERPSRRSSASWRTGTNRRPGQPGGGPGRDPDAAPPWGVRGVGSVAEDDELSRVGQCARRGALCEGRSLAELEPTAPLAGDRAPGYRTTFAEGDGLSSPAAASDRVAARPEDRHDDVEDESRVTNQEPWRVSTKNGLDSHVAGLIQSLLSRHDEHQAHQRPTIRYTPRTEARVDGPGGHFSYASVATSAFIESNPG